MTVGRICIAEHGGPEVLDWERVALPEPRAGQALVRHTAIGVNFLDIYHRNGLYPLPELPAGLGMEAAGVVESIGPGVQSVAPGDRVAYCTAGPGAYAEARIVPAETLVPLPATIDDKTAAASLLKGLTAHFLVRRLHPLAAGETCVIYAAAGGVGSLLGQWAVALGATVIAVAGNSAKRARARDYGAHYVLDRTSDDLPHAVRQITEGRGADVVYDSLGASTFWTSLDCLRPRGLMVTYGNATGPVPAIDPLQLAGRGSLLLTRPRLFDYVRTAEELRTNADELFQALTVGTIQAEVGQSYPLRSAAQAHRTVEDAATMGSTLLIP